jgi:hypothetical protein
MKNTKAKRIQEPPQRATLVLRRETIARLSDHELRRAVGGFVIISNPREGCPSEQFGFPPTR